jgi:hypothetical protein
MSLTGGWAREKRRRNRSGKDSFPGVAYPTDAKPAPPGAAGKAVDGNWPETLLREAVGPISVPESETQNGNPGLVSSAHDVQPDSGQRDCGSAEQQKERPNKRTSSH